MNNAGDVQQLARQIQGGQRAAAADALASIVAAGPELGDSWLQVANMALAIGELSLAESAARSYLAIDKGSIQRLVQCAGVIAETGRLDKALKLVRPRLKRKPDDAALNHFCGTVYQQLGDMALAARHLRTALKSANLSGATWLTLAAQHRFRDGDALLQEMLRLEDAFGRTDAHNQLQYRYALGKALLDLAQYDRAFDAFAAGAALATDASHYNAAGEAQRIDATIAADAASEPGPLPDGDDGRAIFLVGLPRSGTTLLQRILAAHRDVVDGGEFAGMGVASMDFLRRGERGTAALSDVATTYAHLRAERFGRKGMIVDKSINNSYYVGLIARAFPAAPIILLERDALDVAWSCFRTCFNRSMPWSWSLQDIAAHIRAEQRLVAHWKSVFAERVICVRYEDIVRRPQQVLPPLFARCGLEFNDNVYNFHRRRGAVTTASVAQVNQPLNDGSVGAARAVAHRMVGLDLL